VIIFRKRNTRKRQQADSRQPHWIVPLLVGALLTSIITTNVVQSAWHALKSPFRAKPTSEQMNVTQFVRQTEDADFWLAKPAIFDQSVSYFRRHYSLLDPTRSHKFGTGGDPVPFDQLVHNAPFLAGKTVISFGRILSVNLVTPEPAVLDTLIQVVSPAVRHPRPSEIDEMVYCRVPLSDDRPFVRGKFIFFKGVLIAAGNIHASDGGYRPGVYFACSSVTRPKGRCGTKHVPPLPGPLICPRAVYRRWHIRT
jgi:hypothetical protein